MKPRELLLLSVLSIIWGSAFVLIEVVVDDVDPLTIVAGRLAMAAVLMTSLALISGRGLPPRALWGPLAVMAVLNNILPFSLIIWAQTHITSSLSATLNATMPLFTFAFAAAIGSERVTPERSLGIILGFVGAAVLIGPDVTEITDANTLGELAVIGGAMGYAASAVYARERLHAEPLVMTSGQMIIGALIAIPLALAVDGLPRDGVPADAAAAWVALGVLPTGVAYLIYFGLIQRVSATNVSLVSYLIPIVATLLGWVALDEAIGLNLFAGLALIIAGMAAVNGVGARRQQPAGAGA